MTPQAQDAYNKMMAAEKAGIGYKMDAKMQNNAIPTFCKNRFDMSFHTAATLITLGLMPDVMQQKQTELISDLITETNAKMDGTYITKLVYPRVRKFYNIETGGNYPQIEKGKKQPVGRPKTNAEDYSKKTEVCLGCGRVFRLRDDGIHCFCVKCSPDGPAIGMTRETHGNPIKSRTVAV